MTIQFIGVLVDKGCCASPASCGDLSHIAIISNKTNPCNLKVWKHLCGSPILLHRIIAYCTDGRD
jgi:hypothetical protein